MATNLSRLTSALQRNEELTRELESIVQNTTRSLLEYSSSSQALPPPAEPEFHNTLEMGKVRLNVSAPGGGHIIVPCDHRQTVAEVTARIQQRAGKPIVGLAVNGATLEPTDMLGDVLIDGDTVVAVGEGAAAESPTPDARASDNSEDVDMEQLMAEISRKLARADEALRAKAEAEKQSKVQAEALLSVYRSVSKDPDTATRAIVKACRRMLNAELVAMYLSPLTLSLVSTPISFAVEFCTVVDFSSRHRSPGAGTLCATWCTSPRSCSCCRTASSASDTRTRRTRESTKTTCRSS